MAKYSGIAGTATSVTHAPLIPDQAATIAVWFLHLPSQSPAWDKFLLSVITLDDLPGVPPAYRDYPEAQYEVMMLALDPAARPRPDDIQTWRLLRPINYRHQFNGCTDDGAVEMLELVAHAFVDGVFAAEPTGIVGAREAFASSIDKTVRHIARGSCLPLN